MRLRGMDAGHPVPPQLEGTARVVAIVGPVAWLEPEPAAACGACAAAAGCGAAALFRAGGTSAKHREARRFPLATGADHAALKVGDRIVVGVHEDGLLKAALTAYLVPLVGALVAGGMAQSAAGSDALTLAAMAAGLALGLVIARGLAARRAFGEAIAPRFLRHAGSDRCHSE